MKCVAILPVFFCLGLALSCGGSQNTTPTPTPTGPTAPGWSAPVRIDTSPSSCFVNAFAQNRSGGAAALWVEDMPYKFMVSIYSPSTNAWSKPVKIWESGISVDFPAQAKMAMNDSGSLFIVFNNNTIDSQSHGGPVPMRYFFFDQGTASWTGPKPLPTNASNAVDQFAPWSVALGSLGRTQFAWYGDPGEGQNPSPASLRIIRADLPGGAWSAPEVVNPQIPAVLGAVFYLNLLMDAQGNAHLLWDFNTFQSTPQVKEVYHRRWDATSRTWGPITTVDSTLTSTSFEYVQGVLDGNQNLTYLRRWLFNGQDVSIRTCPSGGSTWGPAKPITISNPPAAGNLRLVSNSTGDVAVGWVRGVLPGELGFQCLDHLTGLQGAVVFSPASGTDTYLGPQDVKCTLSDNQDLTWAWIQYNNSGTPTLWTQTWSASSKTWGALSGLNSPAPNYASNPYIVLGTGGRKSILFGQRDNSGDHLYTTQYQ